MRLSEIDLSNLTACIYKYSGGLQYPFIIIFMSVDIMVVFLFSLIHEIYNLCPT